LYDSVLKYLEIVFYLFRVYGAVAAFGDIAWDDAATLWLWCVSTLDGVVITAWGGAVTVDAAGDVAGVCDDTGDATGDVLGDVTGDVTGDVEGF